MLETPACQDTGFRLKDWLLSPLHSCCTNCTLPDVDEFGTARHSSLPWPDTALRFTSR